MALGARHQYYFVLFHCYIQRTASWVVQKLTCQTLTQPFNPFEHNCTCELNCWFLFFLFPKWIELKATH